MQPPPPPTPAGKVAEKGTSTMPGDCARVALRGCQRLRQTRGALVFDFLWTRMHLLGLRLSVLPPLPCESINGQYVAYRNWVL
jgi:hypothetical protein